MYDINSTFDIFSFDLSYYFNIICWYRSIKFFFSMKMVMLVFSDSSTNLLLCRPRVVNWNSLLDDHKSQWITIYRINWIISKICVIRIIQEKKNWGWGWGWGWEYSNPDSLLPSHRHTLTLTLYVVKNCLWYWIWFW
jgi:hypothetical protein